MPHRHDEGTLARRTGGAPLLYFHATAPERTPNAAVGILPGYADHGARYAHVMDAWADRGIASIAIDMRGHGRAEGKRGHCERFDDYLDDSAELVPLLDERAPGVPAFLFGQSFGGLVAAARAIAEPAPWRGLVLSAPYFGLAMDVPGPKVLAGKIASRLLPAFGLPSGLHGADMTHDAARAGAYDEDPLVFKNATARWFTEAHQGQRRAMAGSPSLRMPLYVVFGTEDRVAKLATARAFFDVAGSTDKTWDAREGLFHEVLNEPQWRSIADRIADFVLSRAG